MQEILYEAEMNDTTLTFSHAFSSDRVYECALDMRNEVSSYDETWKFTVQYALENLYFALWDGGFTATAILSPPDFRETLHFILLRDKDQPLPTNVSWTFDSGTDAVMSSQYISLDDRDLSFSSSQYEHVYSWRLTYDVGGDGQVNLSLSNQISSLAFTRLYTIYEILHNPVIVSISHQVRRREIGRAHV